MLGSAERGQGNGPETAASAIPPAAVAGRGRLKVVIVGAGFGGLAAAQALARAPVEITLIDRHNYHCFQPLLYQVATAALSPADIAWPIRGILRRHANTSVMMAAVSAIDARERLVRAGPASVPYDVLVLATGATHSYFGHPEWAATAPGLKQLADATSIRRDLLLAFERAELSDSVAERRRLLTFVVVGGGPTGVEMAGAVAELARHALPGDFRRIDPRAARVILVEAGPRLLPAFPEDLAAYAQRVLSRMGVEVLTSTRVTGCDAQGVEVESGRIDASTTVWAAGVVASRAAAWIEAERDRAGRIKVGPDLTVPGYPDVFAIGDTAAAMDAAGRAVPGVAPAAKQMGRYVARVVAQRASGGAAPGPFRYRHYGDLATIGRKAAIVQLGRLHLTGFVGWLFWSVAHVYFLIGVRNRLVVAFSWLWSYLTLQRGARLIVDYSGAGESRRAAPPPPAAPSDAASTRAEPVPSAPERSAGGREGSSAATGSRQAGTSRAPRA